MVLLGMRLQAILSLCVFSKGSPMNIYKFYDIKEFYNDFLKISCHWLNSYFIHPLPIKVYLKL